MTLTVRQPAVAGFFYEADPKALRLTVEALLVQASPARDAPSGRGSLAQASPARDAPNGRSGSLERSPRRPRGSWRALLLPHAGHVYSGRIAGVGVASVEWPATALLLGPNHRGVGASVALSPALSWRTPLGDVRSHPALASRLVASGLVERDATAHAGEHSLEVILPFLQVARPDISVVCVSLGDHDLGACLDLGKAVADAVRKTEDEGDTVAIVVSSDLNHYLPRAANRAKDNRALDALLGGDPRELFDRAEREDLSMCGILPATTLLAALQHLPATSPVLLAHGDSADSGGDDRRVVGYASLVWQNRETS